MGDPTVPAERRRYDAVKRSLDVLAAGTGLVLASPVMAATAVVVAATLGRPVLFRQQRPGRGGRPFEIVKFRTMREPDATVGDDNSEARMTRAGSRIRSLSVDELPNLWNVLKGDMSIVGPRPLKTAYLTRYSPRQLRRHEVRPGLTGLAQVSGRNALSWDDRLELDVWYVEHRSLRLDLTVLVRTIGKVLRREGVAEEGHATVREFFGPTPTDLRLIELAAVGLPARPDGSAAPPGGAPGASWALADAATLEVVAGSRQGDPGRMDWVAVDRSGRPMTWCGFTELTPTTARIYIVACAEPADRGLIRPTLQLLIARAHDLGLKQLRLEVDAQDAESRRTFADLSFRETGARDSTTIPMALTLV
ncbi:sugar transferase [Agrococcus carbonis]|uniref:Sugar transferase involved in LPS biosynthesis (Colanic, teichoic acid) n=1 Tax=Agrococcus carbonis TaxID=684552 RepID=A0A1H1Q827_9MICO|nr:sugar transferase [Agrococcus carbonis]SDS19586.1 Sugar transferase involved in LPS biosynthesis (colanic, teichoic acid) [Agrococcus carbonis]